MTEILCGPAIRRCNEKAIHIWIALGSRESVSALAKTALSGPPLGVATQESCTPVQMGRRLFLYLLKIVPEGASAFPLNRKIYYDVQIAGKGLQALRLTTGDRRITYVQEKLPSLVIPSKHASILQASCRKPHAKLERNTGQRDQMQRADGLLEEHFKINRERPTMLVLTGDQIYGDDVASPMIAAIRPVAQQLMGQGEELPDLRYGGRSVNPANLKLGERDKNILSKSIGFTSTHGKNHLMGVGEYFAMYSAVWGGIKLTLPTWKEANDSIGVGFTRKDVPGSRRKRKVSFVTKGEYEGERSRLEQFLSASWKTRRLLANVPTYMMFDDHEVTDDWNLEERTREELSKKSSLGRRLTANALAAYWGCQGWGNDPEAFSDSFKQDVSGFYSGLDENKAAKAEEALHSNYWGYTVPGFPALIALDTRTDRGFGSEGAIGPALLSPKGLNCLKESMRTLRQVYAGLSKEQTLLILSPAPVLGFEPIETTQGGFVKLLPFTNTVFDAEYWNADPIACKEFKKTLADEAFTENVIFLSGDVHYGYCVLQKFSNDQPNVGPRYFQLTSSACCNHLSPSATTIFRKIADKEVDQTSLYLAPAEAPNERLNLDNNIGELRFSDGLPTKQILHLYNDQEGDYVWTFDLETPVLA